MDTGWLKDSGDWYFLRDSGAMKTGWLKNGGSWYFLRGNGAMKTGWLKNGGKWYYFAPSGKMITGLTEIGGKRYFFNDLPDTGWMLTGFVEREEGTRYFEPADESGEMATGWKEIGEKTYYFDENGLMATGKTKIDGKTYRFGTDGALIERPAVNPVFTPDHVETPAAKETTYLTEGTTLIGIIPGDNFDGTLTVPSGITTIGNGSPLTGLDRVTSVVLPDTVTEILSSAFEGKESLLDSVTGDFEYYESACNTPGHASSAHYCKPETSLFKVNDSGALAPVDKNALLTALHIPAKVKGKEVKAISADAFFIDSFSINDKLTSVTLPSTITSIGTFAFSKCTALKSIEIPASVTTIGHFAFSNCKALTSVTFADASKLTSIGTFAFSDCTSLSAVYASVNSSLADALSEIGTFYFHAKNDCTDTTHDTTKSHYCKNSASLSLFDVSNSGTLTVKSGKTVPDNLVIPATVNGKTVTSIENSAFKSCTSLTSVTFAEGSTLTTIGGSAFYGCKTLTSITIPSSVTSIGDDAFCDCSVLTSVTFADASNLTSIGDRAFCRCKNLTSIKIPSSVTSIDWYAFGGCTSLTSVTFADASTLTSISYSAFSGCTSLSAVYATENDKLASALGSSFIYRNSCSDPNHANKPHYCKTSNSLFKFDEHGNLIFADGVDKSEVSGDIEIPSTVDGQTVTSIPYDVFSNCTNLTSVTIPSTVTSISYDAFSNCTNLTSVTFAEGSTLTSIGQRAFQNCSGLTEITLPSSVTYLGAKVFSGCTSLKTVTIESTSKLDPIGSDPFSGCINLEVVYVSTDDIRLSGSLNSSGAGTFYFHDSTHLCSDPNHEKKPHYCKQRF